CLLIYLLEGHSAFGPRVRAALSDAGLHDIAISPLVELECLIKPMADGNLPLRRSYEEAFGALTILLMPEAVYLAAAELRARFKTKTPDALHRACAQHHRCEALWTNDDRLARASRGLARNILD